MIGKSESKPRFEAMQKNGMVNSRGVYTGGVEAVASNLS